MRSSANIAEPPRTDANCNHNCTTMSVCQRVAEVATPLGGRFC